MVRKFFLRSTQALNAQQRTILSAASVIGFVYILSAILGFIRNRILSTYFGDSSELGLFFAADDIPSLIFTLIVSGSLSSAFIPVFIKYFQKDENYAWKIASEVMNTSLLGIGAISVILWFSADYVAGNVLARSSSLSVSDVQLLANLMKVLMTAQFGFLFSSYFTSILQSFKRFIIPALAPVFMNLGVIIFILLFTPQLGIYAPAYGTVFGAFVHMFFQLPFVIKSGFKYSPKISFKDKGVFEIYILMIPRIIGQMGQKLLIPLYTNLALFISAPSNVILTFADDLQGVPVRIFGMSIGQAALPIFASSIKGDDTKEFKALFFRTIRQIVFFVLPISILFFILRVPLVRLSVGAKKYSWEATVMTAYVLGFFCISLIFQAIVLLTSRAYYALRDTITPLYIGIFAVVVNAVTAIWFVRGLGLGVWSLALAFTIGAIVNATLLLWLLVKRVNHVDWNTFLKSINRIIIASYAMGVALYVPMKAFDRFIFDTTRTLDLIFLAGTVTAIGLVTFFGFSKLLKIEEMDMITSVLSKIIKTKKPIEKIELSE